ncbi:BTB/POZ domain-containing protein POB1-like protein isoform X2 [Tanacetum coccineum]
MIEELPLDEAANGNDLSGNMECSTVVRVETLHISSPNLAARSPFFYKSEEWYATVRINASEDAAFMELLKFIYNNTLTANTTPALLDVLMSADKFEVASCMRYCSRLLRNLPMTPESALLYLDLPSTVLMAEAVQSLTGAAKQFLAVRYKDMTKKADLIDLAMIEEQEVLDVLYRVAIHEVIRVQISAVKPVSSHWSCQLQTAERSG